MSMPSIYAPYYMQLSRNLKTRQSKPQKGRLCSKCGHVRQFHTVSCNWIRPDATITLNQMYQVPICTGCGHHIYPVEMLQEYNQLKTQKVLV